MTTITAEIGTLVHEAIASTTSPKFAETEINGRKVEARVIEQYRITTSRRVQRPSIAWFVDGRRVAAANLNAALAA